MSKAAVILTAITLLFTTISTTHTDAAETVVPWAATADRVDAEQVLDPIESARVEAAVQLFTNQGLQLPHLTVSFHDSVDDCNGHYGLYWPVSRLVQVCSEMGHVLVHELAHAWMVENLDDATQEAFLNLRELDAWADPDDEWRSRGVEDAAILMRMVLTGNGGPKISVRWRDRLHAFELLTGKPYVAGPSSTLESPAPRNQQSADSLPFYL